MTIELFTIHGPVQVTLSISDKQKYLPQGTILAEVRDSYSAKHPDVLLRRYEDVSKLFFFGVPYFGTMVLSCGPEYVSYENGRLWKSHCHQIHRLSSQYCEASEDVMKALRTEVGKGLAKYLEQHPDVLPKLQRAAQENKVRAAQEKVDAARVSLNTRLGELQHETNKLLSLSLLCDC